DVARSVNDPVAEEGGVLLGEPVLADGIPADGEGDRGRGRGRGVAPLVFGPDGPERERGDRRAGPGLAVPDLEARDRHGAIDDGARGGRERLEDYALPGLRQRPGDREDARPDAAIRGDRSGHDERVEAVAGVE